MKAAPDLSPYAKSGHYPFHLETCDISRIQHVSLRWLSMGSRDPGSVVFATAAREAAIEATVFPYRPRGWLSPPCVKSWLITRAL